MRAPKNPLNELGKQAFLERLQSPRIVAHAGTVVTYRFGDRSGPSSILNRIFNPAQTDEKIKEILSANPDADLTKLEAALGITIIDVQVAPKSDPPPSRKRLLT